MENFFQAKAVEEKIHLHFHNPQLLALAFIHRSFWNEHQESVPGHNERLEFLGDSILGLIVADYLFQNHPELEEGPLSNLRSQLVDAPACARYVQQLGIESYLLLGKGERANRGKGRETIMADLFEALIGALYLDQGLEVTRTFFLDHFKEAVDQLVATPFRNWKAELQDYVQKYYQHPPTYVVLDESGPAHEKLFRVGVRIGGEQLGVGEGSSKKEAQTNAAKEAIQNIEREK